MAEVTLDTQADSRDRWAVALSFLCIAQCLLLPFIASALPMLNLWWLTDQYLHPMMLTLVIPLTAFALWPAYRRHGSSLPIAIAIPAISLLVVGAFIPESLIEKVLTVGGAGILAVAHIINIRLNSAA